MLSTWLWPSSPLRKGLPFCYLSSARMPDYGSPRKCPSSAVAADDDDSDFRFAEVDPSSRYGRYNEVLGKGAFKTVYKGFDTIDGMEVAWNQVKMPDGLQSNEDLERLYSEVHLLKTLKHKNIIKFYHSWVDTKSKNINFITEIFTSGTLRQYCKRHKHADIKAVKNWARQILRGLLYLHSHDPPIIHRDLKCDNIFVNGNQGEVKIGDLGLATILRQAHAAHSVIGTPEFMAPELYEEEYTELVDIYSFGMCLLEMVTSEYPYSECTNAAQIYKKVTSGKKPEALSKVKDPEVLQFIEKCLVGASKRLPARELLMDPFLQSDANRDPLEFSPNIGRPVGDPDVECMQSSLEQSHIKPIAVKISYTLKESSTTPDEKSSTIPSTASELGSAAGNNCKPCSKIEKMRSIDFRVKGKRREDDTVFLRLRIADSEGHVRNIHFPFDIEGDTAMCVASEMVAELDITDQDVTKIAEMIDAAIMALVPEWKPGVAIDETELDGFPDNLINSTLGEDGISRLCSAFDPLSVMSSENSLVLQSLSCPTLWSDPYGGATTSDATSPSRIEGTMHGRFEELSYHCRPEFPVPEELDHCTVSSDSSDLLKDVVYWVPEREANSSPVRFPDSEPVAMQIEQCPSFEESNVNSESMEVAVAFNELVEARRKAGVANYAHETWKGITSGRLNVDDCDIAVKSIGDVELCQANTGGFKSEQLNQPDFSSLNLASCLYDDDNVLVEELRMLVIKHEEELAELRQRHEEAISELKNRWWQRKSCNSSCTFPITKDPVPSIGVETFNKLQANDWHKLTLCKATVSSERLLSKDTTKECDSNTVSLNELTAVLSQVKLFTSDAFVDSVASYNDFHCPEQLTETVLKTHPQGRSAFVNEMRPVSDLDLISKCSIGETENMLMSELGLLSFSLNTDTAEQVTSICWSIDGSDRRTRLTEDRATD